MTIAYASSTSAPAANAAISSATIAIASPPSGTANGDFLLLAAANAAPDAWNSTTGFTALDSNGSISTDLGYASWYKIANNETSYSVSHTTANGQGAVMLRYSGVDTAAAVTSHSFQVTSTSAASPPSCSVTGVLATDMVVAVYAYSADTDPFTVTTPPSGAGWNSRITYGPTTQTGSASFQIWMAVLDITGQTGTVAAPTNAVMSKSGGWAVSVIRLKSTALLLPHTNIALQAVARAAYR
ncbi:MAG: hypothetical protein JWO67_3207 [Streptosporangiaceae bacterium]|nr:hypothetical protein [Streptosporangiaceae bacterium]